MNIKMKIATIIKDIYNIGLSKHEAKIVQAVLESDNFGQFVINNKPVQVNKIAFLIPGIDRYSGGITSILRLGTYLQSMKYDISYVDVSDEKLKNLEINAKFNLLNYKGKIEKFKKTNYDSYDIVIAGNWYAVYFLNYYNAYKMYFIQDYEPYFFKLDERYLLAKKTLELGIHIVSLGKWNIQQIKRECHTVSKLNWIDFPYEPNEYCSNTIKDYYSYKNKKVISIAVYTKEEGKRIPNIIQAVLKNAKESLAEYGIKLEVKFFGLKSSYKVSVGINLGKLTKAELVDLYNKSDFGMVASMTNISLVPYEMLAVGLPVIEMKDGSYSSFLPEESALLIDFNYSSLVKGIINAVENPSIIELRMIKAKKAIQNLSWEKTAEQFSKIISDIDVEVNDNK